MRQLGCISVLAACSPPPHYEIRVPCDDAKNTVLFPETAVGVQSAYRPFLLKNIGETTPQPPELVVWIVEGDDAEDFTVDNEVVSRQFGKCRSHDGIPDPFRSGSECRVDIHFHPSTVGVKRATIRLTGGAAEDTFDVRGIGVEESANVVTSAPDVYVRQLGLAEPPLGFTITNRGTTAVELGEPAVTGSLGAGSWDCPSPLLPAAVCRAIAPSSVEVCGKGTFTTTTNAFEVPVVATGL